jgi:tripartite-type tricarboxylate transporter receptor subunit TctC
VSIREIRKSRAVTPPPTRPKSRRRQRLSVVGATTLHGHPSRVNSAKFLRRRFLHLAAGADALPAVSRIASAQAYPTRPITLIVPLAAGGPVDAIARLLAERMRGSLGQPVTIENVSGAEGRLAVGRAVSARPDGYMIELGGIGNHVMNGVLYPLRYDVLNDFAPISLLATNRFVLLAKKTLPARDLNELIAWLHANPNAASAGTTTIGIRLLYAILQKETGTRFVLVPYRGGPPAMQDLVSGEIDLLFTTPDRLPLVRAGSIKAYAVTSDTRLAAASDIPTFAEMGLPALSFSNWGGLFAPRDTPTEIIGRLNAAVTEALADPTVRSQIADFGYEVFPREQQTPEALGARVKADAEKWWPIIKELGIKAE